MIEQIDFDHVAVAAERQADMWPRYAGDLAGKWLGGGYTVGFASAQVAFANGMRLEGLEPHEPERNDFLRRFIDQSGPGPHHLTFKVGDIASAVDGAESAGYRVVSLDLSDPHWKEAFLHPKDATGIVIQLVQASGAGDWGSGPPADLPAPRAGRPATLVRVVHAVADLDAGRALFADLLRGEVTGEGDDADGAFVDVAWPGPGRLRLLQPSVDGWLAGRPGRLHHLLFACDDPGVIPDAAPLREDGLYEVAPERNLGVRLRLVPR